MEKHSGVLSRIGIILLVLYKSQSIKSSHLLYLGLGIYLLYVIFIQTGLITGISPSCLPQICGICLCGESLMERHAHSHSDSSSGLCRSMYDS